jgi:uncharacterized protein
MDTRIIAEKYGPWVLITGASSGLGSDFAEQLAQKGMNLVVVARRESRLKDLANRLEQQYGIQVRIIAGDLADEHCVPQLIEKTKDLEIGLLVNNAGFSRTGELLHGDIAAERSMYRVNCEAPLMLAMEFGKKMVQRGKGAIIFVSSSVSFVPTPYWTHYAASKAYTLFLGEGLYHELKGKGVDVLALCPGGMKTEFQQRAGISSFGAASTRSVVTTAFNSLGKKPSVIPGWHVSLLFRHLPKILPRKFSLSLYGFFLSKLAKKA